MFADAGIAAGPGGLLAARFVRARGIGNGATPAKTKDAPRKEYEYPSKYVNEHRTRRNLFAGNDGNCYALLTMRCSKRICVARPSAKRSYRCIHETFDQLQARRVARGRRNRDFAVHPKTHAAPEIL